MILTLTKVQFDRLIRDFLEEAPAHEIERLTRQCIVGYSQCAGSDVSKLLKIPAIKLAMIQSPTSVPRDNIFGDEF
jgi:hypothetical protein